MRPIAGAQGGRREFRGHIAKPRRDAFSQTSVGSNSGTRAKDRGDVTGIRRHRSGGTRIRKTLRSSRMSDRSKRPLPWPDLVEDQRAARASIALAQQRRHNFLPLTAPPHVPWDPEARHSSREQESPSCAVQSPQTGMRQRSSPSRRSPSRPQWCGLENGKRRFEMATIGTFKKTGSNEFTGEIVTLSVQAKGVRIVPDIRANGENAPSHRVLVGRAEIGAAWSKRSGEGRDYLGLKL